MNEAAISVVGVDGCKFGWIAAVFEIERNHFLFERYDTFSSLLLSHADALAIAIDIPIGLPESHQPRLCDIQARRFVGPRYRSIFPTPDRRILRSSSHTEASALSRNLSGKGVTQQSFAIFRKIADVDDQMSPRRQSQVVEVHPEVCFRAAANRDLGYTKRKLDGFNERRLILEHAFPQVEVPTRPVAAHMLAGVGADDILDAMIAAWSALRRSRGASKTLPESLEVDARGLRMEMVY